MVTTFEQALHYLFSYIPKTEMRKFPGEIGIARMRELMHQLDDPQNSYRVIHIAGTSGKGSTATITSHALVSQGFKVGLQLSPHLLDIRERVQINNTFISEEKFVKYLNEIIPAINAVSHGEYGAVTYFEILVALAFSAFKREGVEYAVIETGMGGLYDGTNVVTRHDKCAVITKIGFDHVGILGDTLPEIAAQKAGIIQEGNTVVIAPQEESVMKVFVDQASQKHANYITLNTDDYEVKRISEIGTQYFDKKRKKERRLSLIGAHQAENTHVVYEVIETIAGQDQWSIKSEDLDRAIQEVKMPARFDIVQYEQAHLVIDGAHNTQKMDAFLSALTSLYPEEKHVFLVAFKHGKDIQAMIESIEPLAKEIIVTDFWVDSQDMLNISEPVESVASYVKTVPVSIASGVDNALKIAVSKHKKIVITGSLYFASEIYKLLI